ncbi:MAG TPA: hypothetical protein VN943_09690 [Candidatus Acidoferrum sp.]|nr:hypothetical protein [Candidatus Acidoferrum sp.]
MPAKIAPLGMVTHAERAHVGEATASAGSTIYDGDRLSTEAGGELRISSAALTLQLNAQTILTVRHPASPEGNTTAELASGTLVFSAAPTGNIVVVANDALIRPAATAPTVAHIRVVNRKEVRIYAQRGALEFSYHGESEVIPEGAAYRILLDPSETVAAVNSESEQVKKKSPRRHPTFFLWAIGIAAGVTIPVLLHAFESPDQPGPASSRKIP